jgi:hypothetical protein
MRLGVQFFSDPFAYYRHTPGQRAMLLALHQIETGQPVFKRVEAPAPVAEPGERKPPSPEALAKLKPTSREAIERLTRGL